jgi:uncharacterized protein YjdB
MNKLLKGQLLLPLALSISIYACAPKASTTPPAPTAAPTAQAVTPIDPADLNIPGITDGETTEEETPTETPSTTATATPAPTESTAATPTPEPTPTPVPTVTCEAKVEGELTVAVGSERDLTGKISCTDSSSKDESNVTFSSANTDIATIDSETGVVKGIKKGTAKIIVYQTDDSTIKTEVTVTVTANCTISLSGNDTEDVAIGGSKQLSATVSCTGQSDTSSEINWTSSDPSIASISTSGSVSGYKQGTVTITAAYKSDTALTASKTIKVVDALGNEPRARIGEGKLFQPRGIDVRAGKIFVVDYDNGGTTFDSNLVAEGRIQIFDTSGNFVKEIMGAWLDSLPVDLTGIASDGSRIWVTNRIPFSQQAYNIYSFDYSGTGRLNGSLGLTGSAGTDFTDIAIDPSTSNLYVVSKGVRSIIKAPYDTSGVNKSAQEFYFAGANRSPAGVTVDNNGNVFYTDASTNPPIIRKLSTTKELLLEFNSKGKNGSGPDVSAIGDIAYDPRNGGMIYILATVTGSNVILRYDGQGNFVRSFGSGMTDPRNIAVDSEGTIFVTDFANNVVHQYGPGK